MDFFLSRFSERGICMNLFSKDQPVTIVCYGDSNTKYYLGDLQQDGPEGDSYPQKLQELFLKIMILLYHVVILQKYTNVIRLFNCITAPKKLEPFTNVKCKVFLTFK